MEGTGMHRIRTVVVTFVVTVSMLAFASPAGAAVLSARTYFDA